MLDIDYYLIENQIQFTGTMNVDEYTKVFKVLFPAGDSEQFARLSFRSFDNNHDGSVDFREFILGLYITNKGKYLVYTLQTRVNTWIL